MRRTIILLALSGMPLGAAAQPAADLTAQEYKIRVLEYSQQIKQSREQTQAMLEAMRLSKAALLPQLDFSANGQYRINDYDISLGTAGMSMAHETYGIEAAVVQNVYGGGQARTNARISALQHEIAGQGEALTANNVIYAAESSYWATSAKKDLYRVMTAYVGIIRSLEQVLTDRFEEGLISKTDLLQVQARLKEAELQQSEANKAYQTSLQNLNILMGADPLHPVDVRDSITTPLVVPGRFSPGEAFDRRPELKIAELNISRQEQQIKLTRGKYNPSFSVGLKESWGTQMLNFTGETMFNTTAFATLSIPIFHWGSRGKETAMQRALLRNTQYDRQIAMDQISQELSNAWTNLSENTKQIGMAEESCRIAVENLELNTFSYNEGKLPIIDVLSAQATWVQSYSNLVTVWLQHKLSLADYNKAMGNR